MNQNRNERSIGDSLDEFAERLGNGEAASLAEFFSRHTDSTEWDQKLYREGLVVIYLESLKSNGGQPPSITTLCRELPDHLDEIYKLPLDEWEPDLLMPGEVSGYKLKRLLKTGGQGLLYEAVSVVDGIEGVTVAIKFAKPSDPDSRWVGIEAEHLRKLKNPAFPSFHGFGAYRGRPFIAMQKIDADNFKKWLKESDGDEKLKLRVVRQIALAVEHMHECDIVHRDLGPQNIMLAKRTYQPVIYDFGLAATTDAWENPTNITDYHKVGRGGTCGFMPPEQASMDENADGTQGDVFHLGALLFHVCTGELLFAGQSQTELFQNTLDYRLNETGLAKLRKNKPRLAKIVDAATKKDANLRYASAKDFADALESYESKVSSRASASLTSATLGLLSILSILVIVLLASAFSGNRGVDVGIPRELEAVCQDNGVDITQITREDFDVKVELVNDDYYALNVNKIDNKVPFGIRKNYGSRISFRFDFNKNVPLFARYRVYPLEWKEASLYPTGSVGHDDAIFYGNLDRHDYEAEGPLQVKLQSRSFPDGYYEIGPFDFIDDLKVAIESAYVEKEKSEIAAAMNISLFEYEQAGEYAGLGRWKVNEDLHQLSDAFATIRFGDDKENLDRLIDLSFGQSEVAKSWKWRDGEYPIEPQAALHRYTTNGLEFSPKIYAKVEWINGTESDVRVFHRDKVGHATTEWDSVQELMENLKGQNRIAAIRGELTGLQLNFARAAKFIDRIDYGGSKDDLEIKAVVDHRPAIDRQDSEKARHKSTILKADNGFAWSVIDVFSQNNLPFPSSWKSVYFRAVSSNGKYSKTYEIENDSFSPGCRLRCEDSSAPKIFLCSSRGGFRLLWCSNNKELQDLTWADGEKLDAADYYGDKRRWKEIDEGDLSKELSFCFHSVNGSQFGPFRYEFPEEGLRPTLERIGVRDKSEFPIWGVRFINVTQEVSKDICAGAAYKYNLKGIDKELFQALLIGDPEQSDDIVCVYSGPLSSTSDGKHKWAALKQIQLGESKESLSIVHDVDIPLSVLLNGDPSFTKPTFFFKVPTEFKEVWRVFVFADGSKSQPAKIRMSEFDFDRFKDN